MKDTEPHPSDTDRIMCLISLKRHNNKNQNPLWCIGSYVNNKLKETTFGVMILHWYVVTAQHTHEAAEARQSSPQHALLPQKPTSFRKFWEPSELPNMESSKANNCHLCCSPSSIFRRGRYPEHLEVGKLKTFNNWVWLKSLIWWALPKMFLFILKDTGNLELVHKSVYVSGCREGWVWADAIPSEEWKQRIRKYPLRITRMPKSFVSVLSYVTFQPNISF